MVFTFSMFKYFIFLNETENNINIIYVFHIFLKGSTNCEALDNCPVCSALGTALGVVKVKVDVFWIPIKEFLRFYCLLL